MLELLSLNGTTPLAIVKATIREVMQLLKLEDNGIFQREELYLNCTFLDFVEGCLAARSNHQITKEP